MERVHIPQRDIKAEQEIKRMRGIISCAECRRLKLKCDKKIPCSSCKRRGCASICPNGCLTTGQGTRFVLADTEHLHNKLAQMSSRIRALEDALAMMHRQMQQMSNGGITPTEHPLLSTELLAVKTLQDMLVNPDMGTSRPESIHDDGTEDTEEKPKLATGTTDYVDAFGTLAIDGDGAARFYGRSGGQESLLLEEIQKSEKVNVAIHPLPNPVKALSSAFPFSPVPLPPEFPQLPMHLLISNFLPAYDEAIHLCELYLDQAPWFFGPVTRAQLMGEVVPSVYGVLALEPTKPSTSQSPPGTSESPHSGTCPMGYLGSVQGHTSTPSTNTQPPMPLGTALALLSITLAIGSLVDKDLPPAPNNAQAEHYYQLTRAALTTMPTASGTETQSSVLERAPSISTVQTLSLMAIYQGMALKDDSIESTWALMGIATKLAQSIGLHRDSARWKLDAKEVQKRRALFWELFITDSWQSLATGRPPSFTLSFVDCELPGDPDATIDDNGVTQPSFPAWKARFGAECVTYIVEGTITAKNVKYDTVLELDRRVRNIGIPAYAEAAECIMKQEGLKDRFPSLSQYSLNELMRQLMPVNYRGFILVYLHRSFFAQALTDHPTEPRRSQYRLSFVAAFDAACSVLGAVRAQFNLFPQSISRFWPLWTHAFSSAIIVGSVVTRGSRSQVAPSAMAELNAARALFERAAEYGGRAKKMLPVLVRMHDKAKAAIDSARHSTELIRNPNVSSGSRRVSTHSTISHHANHQGSPTTISTISAPNIRAGDRDDEADELSVFGGKTRLVATRQVSHAVPTGPTVHLQQNGNNGSHEDLVLHNSIPPPAYAASSSAASFGIGYKTSPMGSVSTSQQMGHHAQAPQHSIVPTYPFSEVTDVHPSLVEQYRGFDGLLAAQVGSEYGREFRRMSVQGEIGANSVMQNPPAWTAEKHGYTHIIGEQHGQDHHGQKYQNHLVENMDNRTMDEMRPNSYVHHSHEHQPYQRHPLRPQHGQYSPPPGPPVQVPPAHQGLGDPTPQTFPHVPHVPQHAQIYNPQTQRPSYEHHHSQEQMHGHPQYYSPVEDTRQGNLSEMWSTFVQHLEVPNPAGYQYQNR